MFSPPPRYKKVLIFLKNFPNILRNFCFDLDTVEDDISVRTVWLQYRGNNTSKTLLVIHHFTVVPMSLIRIGNYYPNFQNSFKIRIHLIVDAATLGKITKKIVLVRPCTILKFSIAYQWCLGKQAHT